jgi:hypothetical protein
MNLKIRMLIVATALLIVPTLAVTQAQQTQSEPSVADSKAKTSAINNATNIHLSKIDGRHWLVGSDGKPFFAHGITHVGNVRSKHGFVDISTACRKLGFNAYGYGCPPELRGDMPYLRVGTISCQFRCTATNALTSSLIFLIPRNRLVSRPASKRTAKKNKDNPNCIGYCWTDLAMWPLESKESKVKGNWVEFIRGLPKDAPGQKAYQ